MLPDLTVLAEEHSHDHSGTGIWEEFMSLMTDPAHLLFEVVFTVGFDLLVVSLVYGVIIKKFIIPKLRKEIHAEIDAEHGYDENHKKKRRH